MNLECSSKDRKVSNPKEIIAIQWWGSGQRCWRKQSPWGEAWRLTPASPCGRWPFWGSWSVSFRQNPPEWLNFVNQALLFHNPLPPALWFILPKQDYSSALPSWNSAGKKVPPWSCLFNTITLCQLAFISYPHNFHKRHWYLLLSKLRCPSWSSQCACTRTCTHKHLIYAPTEKRKTADFVGMGSGRGCLNFFCLGSHLSISFMYLSLHRSLRVCPNCTFTISKNPYKCSKYDCFIEMHNSI